MKSDIARTVDVFLEGSKNPLLVVLGPTASGKTGFSIELAKMIGGPARPNGRSGGEIVNADSRQLYRKLDIGTAKITKEEREGVPHHLIDVLDPEEELTVGRYQERAQKIIEEIRARGNVPLLVGGSMLYLSSLTDGLSLGPPKDPRIRNGLATLYDRDGGKTLYKKLQNVDPEGAMDIHPHNKPRVVRALEIYEILHEKKSRAISSLAELRPRSNVTAHDLLIFGIERSPAELKERIAIRTEEMFAKGWIDEVRELLASGYEATDPGMKSHGYREIIEYLGELEHAGSDVDIDAMQDALKRKIVTRTRQYAKRQMTWWRGDERIRWITL